MAQLEALQIRQCARAHRCADRGDVLLSAGRGAGQGIVPGGGRRRYHRTADGPVVAHSLAVWRPWRLRLKLREMRVIVMYGLAMGCMNFFFYLSLRSIPLGIAVALEFAGPLALAMAASRRAIDFVWILIDRKSVV